MTTVQLNSSNLDCVAYDPDTETLEVTFLRRPGQPEATYRYYRVPEEVVAELLGAESHGKYFYHNIRSEYRFDKIN